MSRQWLMGLTDEYQALKIWVKLDGYDPDLNRELKARLPGPAIWNGEHKFWVFPAHWDTCVKAREVANRFDANIKISPSLNEWAMQEKARQETIPDVQHMGLIDHRESARNILKSGAQLVQDLSNLLEQP